jgi:alpha-mannosidase
MQSIRYTVVLLAVILIGLAFPVSAVETNETQGFEATAQPTLYVTATAHLDTQWLWTIQDTIERFIPATLQGNFELFEKYPDYNFSFEGAFRYMLAREYYPGDYAKLKEHIRQGRWHVCGSSIDAGDVNVPSPESLIRHILYGNGFFEREFGTTSCDIYLPDCFGFGYALPTVAAHCGLTGFSTQKLTWGSSVGIPFDIGVWEGVDGSTILAALNPGSYVSEIRNDLSADEEWLARINRLGEGCGAYVGYKYFGVGDRGGAPDDESVQWLEKAIYGKGPIRVLSAPADQIFRDLTPDQIARLPRYKGEMLMTRHGTGCYTSQCAMKRWNRRNELLADAAERASVAADWLGGAAYPKAKFEEAWTRFLWHQFHDDLTGTSIPQAYTFSWNDEVISLNQFAVELGNAVGAVARALHTGVDGVPIVVFNSLAFEREDVVEATVRFPASMGEPEAIRVFDPEGKRVPAQAVAGEDGVVKVRFRASVPPAGFKLFDVRPATTALSKGGGVEVHEWGMENERYRVAFDENGDVASIYDQAVRRELLAGPIRLALFRNTPDYWSEWEIRYEDISVEPYAYVSGPVEFRILEEGPARATIEVKRTTAGSAFTQRISLASGKAGDRVEFDTLVDWHTPTTLLKAVFPLAASKPAATYDLGCGTIERPNNTEKKYEVPAQQWADLTHGDGSFGVAIVNDCKYGWDKPDDNTLRLTLIHAPNEVEKDMGRHRMTYAVCGHQGDWREGAVIEQAARLNQPLMAFQTEKHAGALGSSFSFMALNTPQVVVRALKKAERSDEIVLRLQEAHGKAARGVQVSFASPIAAAREMSGSERPVKQIQVKEGRLDLDFLPYQLRTLALELRGPAVRLDRPKTRPVPLPFDADVVSFDHSRRDGDFDGRGHSLPGELLPRQIVCGGIPFNIGPIDDGADNAVLCRGQNVTLPSGDYNRLYVLAASTDGTATGTFSVADVSQELAVGGFAGLIGQSESLFVDGRLLDARHMAPAFIKRDELAWVGTHRHDGTADRNEPYVFCYLFKYGLELPQGTSSVTLPDNNRIRILALTVADNPNSGTSPAQPLYDDLIATHIRPYGGLYIEPVTITLTTDRPDAQIYYTLDGSDPTADSTLYTGPFQVTETSTLVTRACCRGAMEDRSARAAFTFTEPREAVAVEGVVEGLAYHYYEGDWSRLPDFDALDPVACGSVATFDLSARRQDHHYGFVFEGYVKVPKDGIYTFYTASDDGSKLYIGDTPVVDNDGLHGKREKYGQIALRAGMHPVKVLFFERLGDEVLEVGYECDGSEKQLIDPDMLCHLEPRSAP